MKIGILSGKSVTIFKRRYWARETSLGLSLSLPDPTLYLTYKV